MPGEHVLYGVLVEEAAPLEGGGTAEPDGARFSYPIGCRSADVGLPVRRQLTCRGYEQPRRGRVALRQAAAGEVDDEQYDQENSPHLRGELR